METAYVVTTHSRTENGNGDQKNAMGRSDMKKWKWIGIGLVFLILAASFPAAAEEVGTARLSLIEGDVVVLTPDTDDEWVAASINLPLMRGDRLWVPRDGRAEIQFIGRTYLRADGRTDVTINRMTWERDSRIVQTAITEGRVYVNYRSSAGRESVFQVDTPLVSVMAYDDARFDIRVREDDYTEVSVFFGRVEVETPRRTTTVSRGSMLAVGREDYAELSPLGPRSEWIRWNQERDSVLERSRASSRYLPPELDVYSSDFDDYGRWVYVSEYGYVWSPTVVVAGWAPYRYGRWVWMRGDYVWISYEPWGWAPHHYGRWGFRIGIGWFWVPPPVRAVYWCPGFVAWIYTPTYVSWVPLAPREVYYGYGYYGPYSVNVTHVNIRNVNITNVYVNSRVTNAVTVVHRDTFLTGRPARFDGRPPNPFTPGARISPGRPDIKPLKATLHPLPEKVVHERILPPRSIVDKGKQRGIFERPVAVKREASVFKRERPAPLPVIRSERPLPANRWEAHQERREPAVEKRTMPEGPPVVRDVPVRKPSEQREIKGRPSEEKPWKDKPRMSPGERVPREPIPGGEKRTLPKRQPTDTGRVIGEPPVKEPAVSEPAVREWRIPEPIVRPSAPPRQGGNSTRSPGAEKGNVSPSLPGGGKIFDDREKLDKGRGHGAAQGETREWSPSYPQRQPGERRGAFQEGREMFR